MFTGQMDSNFDRVQFVDDISDSVIRACRESGYRRVLSVSDSNTYSIAGRRVSEQLSSTDIFLQSIILPGKGLIADEHAIMSVLVDINPDIDAMIAIGSGTITDIVRFISHRLGVEFLSIPTAPSVDGYSSSGAPIVWKRYKRTIVCHPPQGVFVSTPLLSEAPDDMIAAGFCDVLGKVTALADWELSHLLLDRPFNGDIAVQTRTSLNALVQKIDGIANREHDSIRALFEALTTTGDSIRRFGSSEPASGSEHHISHFIEMYQLARGMPPALHGLKVGLGTLISAGWYERIRKTDREEIESHALEFPDWERDAVEIRRLLGEAGEWVMESNDFMAVLNPTRVEQIRRRLIEKWDDVQDIARTVPAPTDLAEMLRRVKAPIHPVQIGLSEGEIRTAAKLSHYVRSRFTIKTLLFALGINDGISQNNPIFTDQTGDED